MAVAYDPTLIQTFVERSYRRANNAIAAYTLIGVFGGLSIGYILGGLLGEVARGRMPYEGLCILLFGGIAYAIGRDRSFSLRVRAQIAICQMRIEASTRTTPVPL